MDCCFCNDVSSRKEFYSAYAYAEVTTEENALIVYSQNKRSQVLNLAPYVFLITGSFKKS